MKKTLTICNTVYGPEYAEIFLNYHLKSMLDDTNLLANQDRVDYAIYTDKQTLPLIRAHKNFERIFNTCPVQFFEFSWPDGARKADERYRALVGTFKMQVNYALKNNFNLCSLVADLVVAKGFVTKMIQRLDEGHDAVFCVPMRSAFESVSKELDKYPQSCSPAEMFGLAYQNMHPIWVASQWGSNQFSKMPYTMLWNSGSGLLARSFSVSPIALVPDPRMLSTDNVLDAALPSLFKNPFWAVDWVNAPIIGMEPIRCFYPPFRNGRVTADQVREWARRSVHVSQFEHLKKEFWFPSASAAFDGEISDRSDVVVDQII